jgi:hypothetical protein
LYNGYIAVICTGHMTVRIKINDDGIKEVKCIDDEAIQQIYEGKEYNG